MNLGTKLLSLSALGLMLGTAQGWAQETITDTLPPAPPTENATHELPPPPTVTAELPAAPLPVVAINSPAPYYIDRGTTMVPVRPLCDFLGIKLKSSDGVLTFMQESDEAASLFKVVTVRVGGKSAQIAQNGKIRNLALALPAELRLGTTFLPLRFMRDAFEVSIGFRARDNALVLTKNGRRGVLTPPRFVEYTGSNAAILTITNHVGRALSLRLGGPQSVVLELAKGQSVTRKVKPGVYYYKADSAGMQQRSGARRLRGGQRATWSWGRR